MNKAALLSVVIPTRNRPEFLPRAIDSALQTAPDGDVEVLVIPNGSDERWATVAGQYAGDPRVRWHPIPSAHANLARNHGLGLATGKFVRFLDDDDYLLEGAKQQCVLLDETPHDVSQGAIDVVDAEGALQQLLVPVRMDDFTSSVLSGRIFTLLHSFLWRRDRIASHQWSPDMEAAQDMAWALGIARDAEVSLHCHAQPVGAWVLHAGESTSRRASLLQHDRNKAAILLDLARGLERRSALSKERRLVIGTNLWNSIHTSFPAAPTYWTGIAIEAMRISPRSKPDIALLNKPPLSWMHPLALEWLMAPHRILRHRRRMKTVS
jgi:glycosyltransferase involved in cell wall biosynthesis